MQPGPGHPPVQLNSARRNAQYLCRLPHVQTPEEAQFHNPATPLVNTPELEERLVQIQGIELRGRRDHLRLDEGDATQSPTPANCPACVGVVDENAAHSPYSHSQEMGPATPSRPSLRRQPEPSLMDQGRRFHECGRPLTTQQQPGDPAQVCVDRRHQVARSDMAVRPAGDRRDSHMISRIHELARTKQHSIAVIIPAREGVRAKNDQVLRLWPAVAAC